MYYLSCSLFFVCGHAFLLSVLSLCSYAVPCSSVSLFIGLYTKSIIPYHKQGLEYDVIKLFAFRFFNTYGVLGLKSR